VGTADDSIDSSATAIDESYQKCREVWLQSDANQDTVITRSEYINWVINYSPYSPASTNADGACRNSDGGGGGQLFVSQFLGDAPLALVFEELSCLCRQYTVNETCCDRNSPHLELPGTSLFPTSYSATVCQVLDQVLADQCSSSSGNNNSTTTSSNGTTPATNNGNNATTATNDTNNSTDPAQEDSPPVVEVDADPARNSTSPIASSSNSSGSIDGENNDEEEGEGESRRRMVQIVLPLLLVSAAAVFLAVTIVLYQKRKHCHERSLLAISRSRSKARSSSGENRRIGALDAASSTDSDEEAQAGGGASYGSSDDGSTDDSVSDATTAGCFLYDNDAALAGKRRPSSLPRQQRRHRARASRRNSRHPGRVGSLPRTTAQRHRMEPLREGADGEEDEASTIASASVSAPEQCLLRGSGIVTGTAGSESLLPPSVSFGDDDEEEDSSSDRNASTEPGSDDEFLLSNLKVPPPGGSRSSIRPSSLGDVEIGILPVADQSAWDRRDAGVSSSLHEDQSGKARGLKSEKCSLEVPAAGVTRRTKEHDESFDEVSL
jgi:hypothetical protein